VRAPTHRCSARSRFPSVPRHATARLLDPATASHSLGEMLALGSVTVRELYEITDDSFSFTRNHAAIVTEAALDGIYVVRTNLPATQCDAAASVRAYKSLAGVERAFRSMMTVDLELRPVLHWIAPRVRAHVLLCMLAYYHDPAARDAQRTSPVAKAKPSPAARSKAASTRTDPTQGGPLPVHSLRTLLADLATLTRNAVRLRGNRIEVLHAAPTKLQRRALDLLDVALVA
jgi:hypothetical protein